MRQYKMCALKLAFSLTICIFGCFTIQQCFRFFLIWKTQKVEKNAYFKQTFAFSDSNECCCFSFFFLFNLCVLWSRFTYFNQTIQNMFVLNKIYVVLSWRSIFFLLFFCVCFDLAWDCWSPWYNHTGWLGVKHQVTSYFRLLAIKLT